MKLGTFLPSINTHKGHILHKLLCGVPVNNKEMFGEMYTCYSGSRICELRGDGWAISDRPLNEGSSNRRSKEYFIKREMIIFYLQHEAVRNFIDLYRRKYNISAS